MGSGGTQHRGDQRRQVEVSLACGTYDAGEDLLGVGALAGAVAAAHLADDDGGSDGLFGAPVGGVDRRVPQEREDGGEFAGQMGGKALGVVQRRRVVDQPAEPGEQSAAGGGQTVVGLRLVLTGTVVRTEGRDFSGKRSQTRDGTTCNDPTRAQPRSRTATAASRPTARRGRARRPGTACPRR